MDYQRLVKELRVKLILSQQEFPLDRTASIGLTVGTHAGPGCVGIVYFTKEKNNNERDNT